MKTLMRLSKKHNRELVEPYNRFSDIQPLSKGDFTTVYLATWLDDGFNRQTERVERHPNEKIVRKVLV